MRVAFGSDEANETTAAIDAWLRDRGCAVARFGALAGGAEAEWPAVGLAVGEAVASGGAEYGIVCCWTGTGVSIAANKVPGIRAALCADARTAAGARTWNDANVLAVALSTTSPATAAELLEAWFETAPTNDPAYAAMIDTIRAR